ncbi:MAG: ABC transporter permease [Actinomycetia bacterium]|nr:ABC transporter permease [Actinomycetes bacterium]
MILQSLKMAWKAIATNKMRAFLTMLGVIIGVTSLVVLVSLVNSATKSVTDTISSLGNDMLTVSISDNKDKPLAWQEVMALQDQYGFAEVAPLATASVTAKKGSTSDTIRLTGTTPGYAAIQGLTLAYGSFFNVADVNNNTYVAVVNSYTAQTLFAGGSAVGQTVSLGGVAVQIVGVLEDEEGVLGFNSQSLEAYIPYTTLMRISDSVREVGSFVVVPPAGQTADQAQATLTALLLNRLDGDAEAFSIVNATDIANAMESVIGTMTFMLGGIAAISLLVGGIGIMNIMLVSVTERTREIGIRKAVGASYASIMAQFLIEAILISLIGCAIGILLSWGIVFVIGALAPAYNFGLSIGVIGIAVAFSALVGIVFGSYPASKAAHKNPVEALRSA